MLAARPACVSKVKINKVELPFFEDDEYLERLLTGSHVKEPAGDEPSGPVTEAQLAGRSSSHPPVKVPSFTEFYRVFRLARSKP